MSDPDRFDGRPQAFDPEHPDLGWHISEPLPLYCEHVWWARVLRRLINRTRRCCDGVR